MKTGKTAIIILAAGSSSRLGQPKQLLVFEGKTLLRRLTENALLVSENTFVVLGAHEGLVLPTLKNLSVEIVKNGDWTSGIASSVRAGLTAAMAQIVDLEAVILSVCDQPMLDSGIFQKLISGKKQTGKGIVASGYGSTVGVPVLFSEKYFPQLLGLEGGRGAKNLILENRGDLVVVDFLGGDWDIDELHDLKILQ